MRLLACAAVLVAAVAVEPSARASIWVASGARLPTLRVDAGGYAEVAWRDARGARHTVLVPPTGRLLPGGRLSRRDVAVRVQRPNLPLAVVVKRTPDGRLWALQRWRVRAGAPVELHLARWRGRPPQIAAEALCCTTGRDRVAGTVTFGGRPVYGSSPTPEGKRVRLIAYVDSLVGGAWKRVAGVFLRPPDGSFALLVPPESKGTSYRVTVAGPNRRRSLAPDARVAVPAPSPSP